MGYGIAWRQAQMDASGGGEKQSDGVSVVRMRPPEQVTALVLKVGKWVAGEEVRGACPGGRHFDGDND